MNNVNKILNSNKVRLAGLLLGVLALFSNGVHAECAYKPTLETYSIDFGSVTVQRDAPIGSVLATQHINLGNVGYCDEPTNFQTVLGIFSTPSASWVTGAIDTNIPGIGIRNRVVGGYTPTAHPIPLGSAIGPLGYSIQLVKTGPTGSGALTSGRIIRGAYQNLRWINDVNLTAGSSIQTVACSVTDTAINVPLVDVNRREFTGVGSTVPAKWFQIPLDCDADTYVSITIDAIADASGAPGVVALDSVPDSATGVGIQLLHYISTPGPVEFGTARRRLTTTTAGDYGISLYARYYQTQATIKSGPANGTATFTMTYN